jgi:tRNA(adenine34) deaminase
MCAGAIVLSRIPEVIFGAWDPKAGASGSVLDVTGEPRFNHRPNVRGGLLEDECGQLLKDFFAARR